MISRTTEEAIKVWIALGAVGLVGAWRYLPQRTATTILSLLLAFSVLNYARYSEDLPFKRIDTYDTIHYYLNAKYFSELGYYDLYPACIEADHENGGPRFGDPPQYMAQDDSGDHFRPIEEAYARGPVVKARFTPERWRSFTHDFLMLQRDYKGLDKSTWSQMVQDHGYNGTTAWTAIAHPIVSIVPVEAIKWLAWLDVVLLVAAIGSVAWAYDGTAAMWTALFLMVTYSCRWPTISWAVLRYDYIAALIAATSLLKKGRPLWAGVLTGYSATLRLFPALWMSIPGLKGVAGLALERKVQRPLLVLLGGFLLGVAVSQGYAFALLGTELARIHYENMAQHNSSEELSSRRIGLALALNYDGRMEPKNITKAMKANIESQRHLRYGLAALVTLLIGWAFRKAPDDEVFALGFAPFFLFTTASYYYYVSRAPLVAVHGGNLRNARHAAGLAGLFLLEALANGCETWYPGYRVMLIGSLAWAICAYLAVMIAWRLHEVRGPSPAPT
jgi:hypothetical protein